MILVLENIRSLHNVGSIFRTADGAGVEKIYLCGFTPSPLDRFKKVRPEIAKTALGAENTVAWEKVATTLEAVKRLKEEGCRVVSVEQAKGAIPYYSAEILRSARCQPAPGFVQDDRTGTRPLALVFGHEVDGVSKKILDASDAIIEIPMSGVKESLNVSNSVAIILFNLRDRHK